MTATFDKFLSIASAVAIMVVITTLTLLAIDIVTPPSGTVGSHFDFSGLVGSHFDFSGLIATFIFLYGTMFAPGIILSVMFAFYVRGRTRGRPKSYFLEVLSIIIAAQTVFTFYLIQEV
ncbi:MAG: hypothetical protein ABJO67_14925 [Pseudoruegeria sp.]